MKDMNSSADPRRKNQVDLIKRLRGNRSEAEAAKLIGISRDTLRRWARGDRMRGARIKLADYLGTTVAQIELYLHGDITLAVLLENFGASPQGEVLTVSRVAAWASTLSEEEKFELVQLLIDQMQIDSSKLTIAQLIVGEMAKPDRAWSHLAGRQRIEAFAEDVLLEPAVIDSLLGGASITLHQAECLARILTKPGGQEWSVAELMSAGKRKNGSSRREGKRV
jgi:transcriptional regulator with XRE-family HTH domain